MTTLKTVTAALAAAFIVAVALPTLAVADVTADQISAARTAADHEAIARAYDADAAEADARAGEHEAMARAYRNVGGPKAASSPMVSHCNRLVREYRELAKEFRALADEHRKMAREAPAG